MTVMPLLVAQTAGPIPQGDGEASAARLDLVQAKHQNQRRQAHRLILAAGLAKSMGLPAPLSWKVFDAPFHGKLPPTLFLLRERETRSLVGLVALWRPAIGEIPMMHYGLAPGFRGKGYASEAVRAVLARVLAEEGVPGVAAVIANGNEASRRVALAAGMAPFLPAGDETVFIARSRQRQEERSPDLRASSVRIAAHCLKRPVLCRLAAYAWVVPYVRRTINWMLLSLQV